MFPFNVVLEFYGCPVSVAFPHIRVIPDARWVTVNHPDGLPSILEFKINPESVN